MQEKPKDFGLKYGNQENLTKRPKDKEYEKRIRRVRRRPESGNTYRFTKKVSNWKASGHDGICGFWFKKLPSIHNRIALEMNKCLQGAHVLEWMT